MSYLAKTVSKGHEYYKVMESYREGGKVKHRVVYNIGTLQNLYNLLPDKVTGKASDSDQPAQAGSKNEVRLSPVRCRIHGAPLMMYSVAEWLGIQGMMNEFFPPVTADHISRSLSLLLSAVHRACEPDGKRTFADWFENTSLPDRLNVDPSVFASQHFREQMEEITPDQINAFETALFRKIMARFPDLKDQINPLSADFASCCAYISDQNRQSVPSQPGHGKEGRSGQGAYCTAVVISSPLGIPVATMVREGNGNDKTALKNLFSELKERLSDVADLTNMTCVFDGGGVSEEALEMVPGSFIACGAMSSSPELYEISPDAYEEIELEDGDATVTAYRGTAEQFGRTRTAVIFLSEQLKNAQVKETNRQTERFIEQITGLNARLTDPRAPANRSLESIEDEVNRLLNSEYHLSEFIDISYETVSGTDPVPERRFRQAEKDSAKSQAAPVMKPDDGAEITKREDIPAVQTVTSVKAVINEEKKQSMADRYYGKHLLITDLDSWSTERILSVYRDREQAGQCFRDAKDAHDFLARPAYRRTGQKLRVHAMIRCLGLALCRTAQVLLKQRFNYHITCSGLLDCLSRVQECRVMMSVNGEKVQPMTALSELEGKDKEVWGYIERMLGYLKENPAASAEINARES